MLTLLVDFNSAPRDGRVRGLREQVSGAGDLAVGQQILLRDGEGNEALGTVQRFDERLVTADVAWDTWGPEGHIATRVQQQRDARIQGAETVPA